MDDLISRQNAQERQRVAQKRRYTFGNDEFSLEAAYHDCKLVFDGITDDDSFQEADTGLVLYYANEIIYALHETLQGKDTNVLSNDCISRQAAIATAVRAAVDWHKLANPQYSIAYCIGEAMRQLPSAEPERKTGHWIEHYGDSKCSECGYILKIYDTNYCPNCGARMDGESD